jgi:Cu2+-exporting ATPase
MKLYARSRGRPDLSARESVRKGHNLDLLVDGDAKEFINNDYPSGMSGMSVIADNIVRITHDAKLVGAKGLLQNAFAVRVRLAPP